MERGRFPNKLKKYRHIAGYSQKKVARVLKLPEPSIISRWEHGELLPKTMQVLHLLQLYNTTPQQVFDVLWNQIEQDLSLSIINSPIQTESRMNT